MHMAYRLAAFCLFGGLAAASVPAKLSLPDLSGNPQALDQYRGRVIVLNFWATWCEPCRDEMPLLSAIQERYASRGVVVVGASADDESTRPQIKPFVEKLGIRFPVWTGATTAHLAALGLGAALPATAILDQEGQIAFRILGVLKARDLTKRLDYLLSGKRGKAPEPVLDTLSGANDDHAGHEHSQEEKHSHGGVGVEGASTVPS